MPDTRSIEIIKISHGTESEEKIIATNIELEELRDLMAYVPQDAYLL